MVIQACQIFTTHGIIQPQDYESDPAPGHMADSLIDRHIVLLRPHTVLLLATVAGGLALRGTFTGALADEIRRADGKTDICAMFNRAVNSMMRNGPADYSQTPELRATTSKDLFLPPALQRRMIVDQPLTTFIYPSHREKARVFPY